MWVKEPHKEAEMKKEINPRLSPHGGKFVKFEGAMMPPSQRCGSMGNPRHRWMFNKGRHRHPSLGMLSFWSTKRDGTKVKQFWYICSQCGSEKLMEFPSGVV